MHVEDIEYEADDRRMIGHLAFDDRRPAGGPRCCCRTRATGSTIT